MFWAKRRFPETAEMLLAWRDIAKALSDLAFILGVPLLLMQTSKRGMKSACSAISCC